MKRDTEPAIPLFLDSGIVQKLAEATWYGKANRLSGEHGVQWEIIDEAAAASWKVSFEHISVAAPTSVMSRGSPFTFHEGLPAGQIIRQRRSAVSFDGKTSISAATFFHMMQLVMPRSDRPQLDRPMPWDVWPYEPAIHLLLFVHRVEGLKPGLYFLVRDPQKLSFIQQSMNPELTWTPAPGCPEDLPLYLAA